MRRYLQQPEFKAAYEEAAQHAIGEATRAIQGALPVAVGVLRTVLESTTEPATVKLNAARLLLDYGLRWTEMHDVIRRVTELEEEVLKK